MNARPAHLLIATLLFAAGSILGCGPGKDEPPSAVPFDTQPPSVPSGVTASRLSDGTVLLSWEANRTDPDLAGYVIYRSVAFESGYRAVQDEPVRSNSWVDDDGPADQAVYYRIAARDAAANESALSPVVSTGSGSTVPTAASVVAVPAR